MSKVQVQNRGAAAIQITAEQLLREAKERGLEDTGPAAKQFITDAEELKLYQQGKRKDFEDQIRRQRQKIGLWTKYGLWEASQKEFERARSVFERALDVDYRNQAIWMKYIEMEMKNKFVNHARNIFDRAVEILPRVDIFWFKYSYMEEMIGAVEQARQVFERWMKWEPEDVSWHSYIKFEMRQGNVQRARGIYERYLTCHPTSQAFLKYAKWEEAQNQLTFARAVYERSLSEVHHSERTPKLLINFARFEERCKEVERARVIYRFAIDTISSDDSYAEEMEELKQEFISFEKRHGSRHDIEEAIINRRRAQYESLISKNTYDYDNWFDYIRLEESEGDETRVRSVYERAIGNVPPIMEKRYWKRYIYLWINYAVFEELQANDVHRTREVYRACLKAIPHKQFTFGKIWLLAAQFEVRQRDLSSARKLLGQAIGLCSKENIFKGYIDLEMQLGEIDRCRSLYAKYIETMPFNTMAWKNFAKLETDLGEAQRARAIFDIAIQQPELDMPETLWKAYIDFEISEGEVDRVRALYDSLLSRTQHVKVWIAFGQFEASLVHSNSENSDNEAMTLTRGVFQRGYDMLKSQGLKEERLLLIEAWRDVEAKYDAHSRHLASVEAMFPKKVKLRRPVLAEDGSEVGTEEYMEYQFPDDEKKIAGLKLLENAMKWKMMAQQGSSEEKKELNSTNTSNDNHVNNKDEIDIDDL